MKTYEVAGHEPSLLPDGEFKLVWSDEFDGTTLDTSKWSFRRHLFHKENPGYIGEEGIELDGKGCIHFKQVERDGKLCSTQLQTGENWYDRPCNNANWSVAKMEPPKFEHKYGYYEVRCKLQDGDNWWSAFWLQSPNIGTHIDPGKAGVEVDIMESFLGHTYIPHYIHWGGYGENYCYETTLDEHKFAGPTDITRLEDTFHRFGCLWEEDGYTFYVDGVQSGRKLTGAVSHTEQFVLLSTECLGYRTYIPGVHKDAKVIRATENDEFIVDYVRVFDKI